MSLPPAVKDISDHPAKGAVTDPLNKEKLGVDLDRKLKLYGVLQALRLGKLPTNAQIDESLDYVESHSPVDLASLSPAGKQLIQDLRRMIETARTMVREKNNDELFQYFLWHTRDVQVQPANASPTQAASLTAGGLKDDSIKAAHHLRVLISLLVTNSEARKLFSDFFLIGRDLLARSAKPQEDALKRVDEPVSDDQPKFQPKDSCTGLPLADQESVRQTARDVRQGSEQAFNVMAETAMGLTQKDQRAKNAQPQEFKNNASATGSKLKDTVPEKQKTQITTKYNQTRDFLLNDYFPEERRERLIYRLKKVIVECQSEKEYQESIRWLLDMLSHYTSKGAGVASESRPRVDWEQGSLKQAKDELFALLTRVANNHSPQSVVDAGKQLYDKSHEDDELREWFNQITIWLRKMFLEKGYVVNDECVKEGRDLRENGRKFFDQKYKVYFDNLFNAIGDWLKNVIDDPLNERLMSNWTRLIQDLLFNSEGALSWKPELWADIRHVILPQLIDKAGYIPIPRAEYTDQSWDFVVENMALSGQNLFPNIVTIEARNYVKFSPHAGISDQTQHNFTIKLSQIQTDLRDVRFYFNKKTGFPKVKDSGIADVLIGGNGITTTIHLLGAEKGSGSVFNVKNVKVNIDQLKFSIRDSKHDKLYRFLRIFTKLVKTQVQRAVQDGIISALVLIDQQLAHVRDKMEEARVKEGSTRIQVLRDILKRQSQDIQATRQPQLREKRFNFIPKRDSLILPEEGSPSGWIRRQDFENKIAVEGEEWRSAAFSLVKPSESSATDGSAMAV